MRGGRQAALIAVAGLVLAACGGAEANGADASEERSAAQMPTDGPADTGPQEPAGDTASEAAGSDPGESGPGHAVAPGQAAMVTISVAGHPVRVEVADEPEERQQGLMYRDSLPDGQGMLFVYEEERTLSFWMRNTQIPLDIAFLDRSGRIVDIRELEPFDEESVASRQPAMYALEVRRGWFEENEVRVGDRVEL